MNRPTSHPNLQRITALLIAALVGLSGCSNADDESGDGNASDPATSTAPSFCDTVSDLNDSLDFIGAAFLSGDQQESPAELRDVLAEGLDVMNDSVASAPTGRADAARTIRDAYAGLQDALTDVDHVVGALDADDDRLAALTDPGLSAAIMSVNDECA